LIAKAESQPKADSHKAENSRKWTAIDCQKPKADSHQPKKAESGQPLIANISGNRKRAHSIVEIDLTLTFLQPNLYQMNFLAVRMTPCLNRANNKSRSAKHRITI
jgi:hypothetical protein